MNILRPYQHDAVTSVMRDLQSHRSTLLVLPTGCGKTTVFSYIAKNFVDNSENSGRVLVLARRNQLIEQARENLASITGQYADVEMGDQYADKSSFYGIKSRYIVSTVQSQISGCGGRGRMTRFAPTDMDLVIYDEAHESISKSSKAVIAYYQQNPKCKVLGVTATPDRADKKALGQVYEKVSYVYEILDAINDGWLVPIMQRSVYVEGLDFSQCRTTAGDLNGGDVAAIMEYESNLHGIASPTIEIAGDKKTLIFAASVAHSNRLAEILNRHKPGCARCASAATDPVSRKKILRDYRSGEFQYLVNCDLYGVGFDEPSIQLVVQARPTKSRSKYAQQIGRGTRPLTGTLDGIDDADMRKAAIEASGKPFALVLDFVGNSGRHKLVTTADVLGGKYSEDVVARAAKDAQQSDAPVDMRRALDEAQAAIIREAKEAAAREEAAHRAKLVGKAKYSTSIVNAFDVLDLAPSMKYSWNKGKPATERQIEALRRMGIPNAAEFSSAGAGQVMSAAKDRRVNGKCTFHQAKTLRKYGYDPNVNGQEASAIIDAIAANGWKRPSAPLELVGAAEGEI